MVIGSIRFEENSGQGFHIYIASTPEKGYFLTHPHITITKEGTVQRYGTFSRVSPQHLLNPKFHRYAVKNTSHINPLHTLTDIMRILHLILKYDQYGPSKLISAGFKFYRI
jgi:hypothetical protein